MSRHLNDQGVSVIVGTLLLILITVTAAAGLAVMVSQMQKDEMNRQTHLAAVKNENIAISGMSLTNNATLWNSTPFNITNSQNWSSVSFNLMNLNTEDVSVMGIAVNNYYSYPLNFSSLSLTSEGYCNFTTGGGGCRYLDPNKQGTPYLTIPAGNSVMVKLNLTSNLNGDTTDTPRLGTGDQINIKILTSLTNIFEQTYRLPTAVIVYKTDTTNLGSVQWDTIVLDGAQSSSGNATIVRWDWTFKAVNSSCSENGTVVSDFPPSGKSVRYSPNTSGPFCAQLAVTDSNGMVATSPYQFIPKNSQFSPAANLVAYYNTSSSLSSPVINVTITDVNGKPVPNVSVNYIIDYQSSAISLSNYVGTTDSGGNNSSSVFYGVGTVKIMSGQLPDSRVTVNNPAPTPTATTT